MKVTVNVNIPIKFIFWSYVIALFWKAECNNQEEVFFLGGGINLIC